MLIQFLVENHLSFREATVFSLRATNDTRLSRHVVTNSNGQGGKALPVLRGAALYGANAAGKSNLVLAMDFARRLIIEGTRGEATIPVRPFKLDPTCSSQPSRFEFIFRHEGVLYSYGFAASARRVHEEWLFATPERNERRIFERVTDEHGATTVETGPTFKREIGAARVGFLAEGTRANQLFLTECIERNVDAVKSVHSWFFKVLTIVPADSQYQELLLKAHSDPAFLDFLSQFLSLAGTGIEGATAEVDLLSSDWIQRLPLVGEEDHNFIREKSEELKPGHVMTLEHKRLLTRTEITRDKWGNFGSLVLRVHHRDSGGRSIAFETSEESEGTQRFMHLVPALWELRSTTTVLVIDELDRRLHTLLTRLFIQQALDCGEDAPDSQLIFTTHDTNLLDLSLLRRDEIWFAEKDERGATHLASLAEWKIRPDLEIEKGYLNGRFGAIPFFGDVSRLLCEPNSNGPDGVVDNKRNAVAA